MNSDISKKRTPPGMVGRDAAPEVVMMLCTAGHVDHGKTALVRLLTGCETDRLREEKRRGLTIELGFAPCLVSGDKCVGIVDAPGHEKFIRNMAAGVSGVDACVLVVAADDGVMPQTAEHLDIMELLGVRRGLVALTKIDLVSEERVHEVKDALRNFLKGTFLQDAPIRPVSSVTLSGFDEFYKTLTDMIEEADPRRRAGIFRMPVERVFTREGFGLVLSGIPVSGSVRVGDEVEIVPGGRIGRVRAMQRFLGNAGEGHAGQCLALNVPDFEKGLAGRGCVLCRPGYLKPSSILHLKIRAVKGLERPLKNAEFVKLHTGTSEINGKLYLLEGKTMKGGAESLATFAGDQPVAAALGDRFIIRRPSPAETVAGGSVLELTFSGKRPPRAAISQRLLKRLDFFKNATPGTPEYAEKLAEFHIFATKTTGDDASGISRGALLPREDVSAALNSLVKKTRVAHLGGDYYVHQECLETFLSELRQRVKQYVSEGRLSVPAPEFWKGLNWPAVLASSLIRRLEKDGVLKKTGDRYILKASSRVIDQREEEKLTRLRNLYEESGFQSPRPDQLSGKLGVSEEKSARLLEHLINQGDLIRLDRKVVLSYNHMRWAQEKVADIIKTEGKLDSADFKKVIGSSRKYALAILDYLDKIGVTVRVGNDRKLAADYEKRLL